MDTPIFGRLVTAFLGALRVPISQSDLNARLAKLAQEHPGLDWKNSIVDLLKLVNLDSSENARRELAKELGYNGTAADGSAEKNIWLHQAVMRKLSEHGISIPS